jgi:hypothetical protein
LIHLNIDVKKAVAIFHYGFFLFPDCSEKSEKILMQENR